MNAELTFLQFLQSLHSPMLDGSMGLCRDCRAVRKVSSAFIRLPLSRFVVYRIPEVYEQKSTKS